MIKFLLKTMWYTIVGLLVLYGAQALYLRWRDRDVELREDIRIATELAGENLIWIRGYVTHQGASTNTRSRSSIVVDRSPERSRLYHAHTRKIRKTFRKTVNRLSESQEKLEERE